MTVSADNLLMWMIGHTEAREELMEQERSRAVHQEFLLAESGQLPAPEERLARMRDASARAWLRLMARAVGATWPGADPAAGEAFDSWLPTAVERLEALEMEEHERLARRGLSGDPVADRRDAELAARTRLFAEWLGDGAVPGTAGPAATGRAVADWCRANPGRLEELVVESRSGPAPEGVPEERLLERAVMWAHVRLLAEALEATGSAPAA